MKETDVRERAFCMPLTSPAYPPGLIAFASANISSSPTALIVTDCTRSCPSCSR